MGFDLLAFLLLINLKLWKEIRLIILSKSTVFSSLRFLRTVNYVALGVKFSGAFVLF